jgi:yecA family protein
MHDDHHDCDITPLTDADLAELRDFLDRRCLPQIGMNLPMLDGLLAAFHTAPMYAHSVHWDEPIYGMASEEAKTRFFTSPEEAERVDDLLWNRFHDVDLAFVEKRIGVTFFGSRENDVEDWCVGYLRGVLLHEREWEPLLNPAWEISLHPNIVDAVEVLSEY